MLRRQVRSPATGETYEIKDGYLDLLKASIGADSPANLTNFLPGAGRGYEPLWRARSLTLLTGEFFPNERELEIIMSLVRPVRGERYLDLGCSAGLYARTLARYLNGGDAVGIDISPSMLREADRRARLAETKPSFVRANAANLPFIDSSFAGAVCGGSLNEFRDPKTPARDPPVSRVRPARIRTYGAGTRAAPRRRILSRGITVLRPDDSTALDTRASSPPSTRPPHPVFFAARPAGAKRAERRAGRVKAAVGSVLYNASTVSGSEVAPGASFVTPAPPRAYDGVS